MEKVSEIFLEIEGESLAARRVRYWRWQRMHGKQTFAKRLKTERGNLSTRQMTASIRLLMSQVETLSQRLEQIEAR